jgi:hypothetical protein
MSWIRNTGSKLTMRLDGCHIDTKTCDLLTDSKTEPFILCQYPFNPYDVISLGGQGWTLELLGDLDSELTELSHNACFSTSFHSCSKVW